MHAYRIETEKLEPEITASIPMFGNRDSQTRQMIPVPRGNFAATSFTITRRNFSGDLDFIAQNLPEGVTMHAPKAPSNFTSVPILFSAKPDATLSKTLTKIDINYKTLNGDQQQNKMVLKNTLLFLAFYPRNSPNLEIDLGYGSGKLTRNFYGYQSPNIVTSNISGQVGAQETSTTGSNMMIQVLYRIFGNKFRFVAGARYSMSKHKIPDDDLRPGYDEKGIPTAMDFDLGGLGVIGTATLRF